MIFKIVQELVMSKNKNMFFLILLFIMPIFYINTYHGQLGNRENNIGINVSSLTMNFSTYIGGSHLDRIKCVATAIDGSCYVTGETESYDFPTLNAFNDTFDGSIRDAFIVKFAGNGSLLWSTFFGGKAIDYGNAISVDSSGSCYITGKTASNNFPILNAYNSTFGGATDAFVAKFSTNGTLLWSTYLGGSEMEEGWDIVVDNEGNCYVTGVTYSINFPMLNAYSNTFGGMTDVFVAKFAVNGSFLWSTFLGGNSEEYGFSIDASNNGVSYVTGFTSSSNFPTLNAYDDTFNTGGMFPYDTFITTFSDNGSLLWSTYFGGNDIDAGNSIVAASDGSCFVTGQTASNDFPTLNAYDSTFNSGSYDTFIAKFSHNGILFWSTYIGGNYEDIGMSITVDNNDSCYISGTTSSSNFPMLNGYNSTYSGGGGDVFITRFSSNGLLYWSTFLGGGSLDCGRSVAFSTDGACIVSGDTGSNDFPIKNAFNSTYSMEGDAFITKFIDLYDVTKPTISATTANPLTPTEKDSIMISSLVMDESGIQAVTLYYKINSNVWLNKGMTIGLENNYSTIIGPYNSKDIIKYYIEAVDDAPNHNVAIDDNETHLYQIIIRASTTTQKFSTPGFLTFISIILLFVPLLRKRRK